MRNIRIVIMSVLIVVGFQASNNAFSDVNVTTKFQESTYDGFRKLFKQLYKEIRIMDALSESNCSFYQFGSNDYKIGEIITYIEDTLIKKGPLYFVNNFDILKCENISKDFISAINIFSISGMSFFSLPNTPFSIKPKSPANSICPSRSQKEPQDIYSILM